MKPAISIIVPVHNVELYLDSCLKSILGQTLEDFEVILINNGSTDSSGLICDAYSQKDKRVKVKHLNFAGVSEARNLGVDLAQGEYIGFVDADDRIEKDMYYNLLKLCRQTDSDVGICQLGREIDGKLINEKRDSFVLELEKLEALKELFKGILYRFSLCNKLFKKNCFHQVKFPEGRIHEDLATTYKLFSNANRAVYTNEIGYIYIKRTGSILTAAYNERRLDAFIGWDEILQYMTKHYPSISKECFLGFAYTCIDHMNYIITQVHSPMDQKKYLSFIRCYIRKYLWQILKNKTLPPKQLYLLTVLNVHVDAAVLSLKIKNNLLSEG
ncbi:glycosyltransferase [Siminovitchia sediminis]|uniref:Glycosyltransferase n=1 Tax=Siminovitchia sediminis TaxID=1274353 RepID=A0ABW4KLA6_9BACI